MILRYYNMPAGSSLMDRRRMSTSLGTGIRAGGAGIRVGESESSTGVRAKRQPSPDALNSNLLYYIILYYIMLYYIIL